MVSDPWGSEKGCDVPTFSLRSHDTHPQDEMNNIMVDGRRHKVKLQMVRVERNRHCSGRRRKFCEGGGQYWMGWFGAALGWNSIIA